MTRHDLAPILAGALGAFAIVAFAFAWLVASTPARGADGCAGATLRVTWYGTESGNRTASGERFNGTSMTAAHRSYPFGTKLRVTYRGKSVVVRVNDRGPAKWTGNDLDLSRAAAARIGMIGAGRVWACVQRLRS